FTPKPNRHMLDILSACGYTRIVELPEACWYERKNKFVDCVVSVATRQSLLKAKKQLEKT
ncbi:MAG: hypothetical protein LUE20_00445, partial [Oscillospiraceae bacterium]|nr:hypothetical protein [Oscillospiraceae bacterium]